MKQIKLNKTEWSWASYDVAFSAFAILSTAFLPIMMKLTGKPMGLSDALTTAHWGYLQSFSTLVIALLAPVLGAIADFKGKKKLLFSIFFVISIFSLASMLFSNDYWFLLVVNFICAIGYSGTNIIYDAYLVDVTDDSKMNFLSSLGFGIGYAGRCIPYIIGILLYSMLPFGISEITALKIAIGLTTVWWVVFTLPFFKNVKQRYGSDETPKRLIAVSLKNTWGTFKRILKDKNIALFLLAYFFYIDGVNTLITMSSDFGYDIGVSVTTMALALLATQIIAAPSVLLFERLARRFSTKVVIQIAICIFALICGYALFMRSAWQFWVMAVATGFVLGTIQALSRSYFGRMIPDKNRNNEYFGFFNVLSRYSSILGPLMISLFTLLTGSSRYGVLSIVILFVVGFVILLFVKNIDKKTDSAAPEAVEAIGK